MPTTHRRFLRSWPALLGVLAVCGFTRPSGAETWADWRMAGPFICRADFSLEGMGPLFDELAQLQQDLVGSLGLPPADEPIELYLFRDQSSYRRFVGRYLPDVPYRRALYVKSGGTGMVFVHRSRQFGVDVRHECTHALLHATLPMVPLWLDEGLAEYFEVSPAERAFNNPHLSGVRWKARLRIVPQIESLENIRDLSKMGGPEYRNAWAWTHFMLHGPVEARNELRRFLADIHRQAPPGRLSQRLPAQIPDLKRRFATHFSKWKR